MALLLVWSTFFFLFFFFPVDERGTFGYCRCSCCCLLPLRLSSLSSHLKISSFTDGKLHTCLVSRCSLFLSLSVCNEGPKRMCCAHRSLRHRRHQRDRRRRRRQADGGVGGNGGPRGLIDSLFATSSSHSFFHLFRNKSVDFVPTTHVELWKKRCRKKSRE